VPEYGDRICICSSLKDALCLWANTGIPSLAVQGEGYTMSNTAINELKRRFRDIYILFDNDKAGLENGIKFAEITGFNNLVLPTIEELGNPTKEEIKMEIEEVKETIENEKIWALTDDIHYQNIEILEEYLEVLEDMLNN
jgi:DNA primase